jgi:bifunctional enzyme CysN/CysC
MTTPYIMKHTTRYVKAYISKIIYKIDVNTLHREQADAFGLNEIGRVEITTASPVFFDPYKINRATGSFILIDPVTNNTVAGGMIRGVPRSIGDVSGEGAEGDMVGEKSPNIVWRELNIPREQRETRNDHKAAVLWFTGYSGAGKTTIAKCLEKKLFEMGCRTMLLDGDHLRHGLCGDLGFSEEARRENIRRAGEVGRLFFESGDVVICTFISPFMRDRQRVRSLFPSLRFYEIYVKCDLNICKRRDPHGLYQKAIAGEIGEFTGISSPYEEPLYPEMIVETDIQSVEQIVDAIIGRLRKDAVIKDPKIS